MGPALVRSEDVDLGGYVAGDGATEAARSEGAVGRAVAALEAIRSATEQRVGEAEAAIFDAHLALLDDPAVTGPVAAAIEAGTDAPAAWAARLDALAAEFDGLDDAYQRERGQDVRAVRRRILAELAGTGAGQPELASEEPSVMGRGSSDARESEHGVLVVAELDAATAATIDVAEVAGIATRAGGATGHGVIVARSRGIPIVTGIGEVAVEDGQTVAFDGRAGRFVVDPDDAVRDEFRALIERRTAERDEAIRHAGEPAVTTDGHSVRVFANIGSVADAHAAARLGADGAGLVRTEVLFADRGTAPTVDEQADVYREISAALGGRPMTIRTWDVGGDKPLPFLPLPAEPNPFLGERGLRVFRHRPELLTDQLKAICRVAREVPVRVMFPMVTTAEEVDWARELLATLDPPEGLEVGIMVEVPAAALKVAHLAKGLDFVSIGTNDLTQYVTAADRGNSAVSALADGLDPAVLALIRQVTAQVTDVAVCGDLASDPDAAALLTGLGVGELSATAPQVPLVKARLRRTARSDEQARAERALAAGSASEVRRLLTD